MNKPVSIIVGFTVALLIGAIFMVSYVSYAQGAASVPSTAIVTSEPQPTTTVTVSPEPAPTVTVTATPSPVSVPTYDECMYANPVPQYCIDNYEAYNG